MHSRPGDLERRQEEPAEGLLPAGDLELRAGERARVGVRARQHHVHRQAAAALGNEPVLGRRHHLGRRSSRLVALEEDLEPTLVDADGVTHRLELGRALHSPSKIELDVEGHEVEPGESLVVANRHDVLEPEDADPAPPRRTRTLGHVRTGTVVEHLLDRGGPMLAHIPRLGREHDEWLAVAGHDHVRVTMDDLKSREIGHRPFETRVLAPGDDERVQVVLRHRGPDVRVAAIELGVQLHESSSAMTRAVTVSFRGVGTPISRPKRAMPPLR